MSADKLFNEWLGDLDNDLDALEKRIEALDSDSRMPYTPQTPKSPLPHSGPQKNGKKGFKAEPRNLWPEFKKSAKAGSKKSAKAGSKKSAKVCGL